MRCFSLALVLAFATCGQAAILRGRTESLSLQLQESADWASLSEASAAESEDRSFLMAQLDETESELKKLQQFVAGLQIPTTPIDKKASVAVENTVKMPEPKKEKVAKTPAPKIAKDLDPAKVAASLGIPSLSAVKGLKGQMALAPMLAMLNGLYEESKERISQQNVREAKSKKWFAEKEAEHKTKVATIEGKFANHTLSEEFHTNETADETRYFTYWQRCRERQHRQFHTNLKIQHGMMMKVKGMINMYEKALSPKASDQVQAKKQLGKMTGMPDVVFLQKDINFDDVKRDVVQFCSDSLAEVWKVKEELHQDSDLQQQLAGEGLTDLQQQFARDGMTY